MADFELYVFEKPVLLVPITEAAMDYALTKFIYWYNLFSIAIAPELFESVMDGIEAEGSTVDIK